jgi:hypothetical protein
MDTSENRARGGPACLGVSMMAQVQTQTNTSAGTSTKVLQVERAQVVHVDGNDLVIRMEHGTIRHIRNVPESAKATVNGKEIGIHGVKVGMKLERTITTTTTPKLVTTVQTVTGKVWHVNPPNFVILTLDDGNQRFNISKGQKFNINRQMTDAWGLKKGMTVSATKVVEEPVTDVTVQKQLTATEPPPPPPDVPILVAVLMPVSAPGTAPAAELPKTGSLLPLLGLLGGLSLATSFALRALRSIS